MAVSKTLFGTTRLIPQVGEIRWGNEVTNLLVDIATALGSIATLVSQVGVSIASSTSITIGASGTITPTHTRMQVGSSTGGAVTLSTTTAILDAGVAGQILILEGTSDSATVTVPNAANTDIAGPMLLALGSTLVLTYSATRSLWIELSRTA